MSLGLPPDTFDAAGAKVGAGMTYTGSGVAAVSSGLSLSEWGVIVGILTAILGLGLQFWFKWREDQRQERYWERRSRNEP